MLRFDGDHDARLRAVALVHQDEVRIPGTDRHRLGALTLDLGTAIDGDANGGSRDPEQVEGQPGVILEEEEDALVQCSWHAVLVGPARRRLQRIT